MAHHNVSIMADLFHLSQHDGSASFPVSHWGLWKINRLTNTHTKSPPFAFPTLFCSILSLVLLDSTVISPISSSCFCEVNISNHPWDAHCLRPSQFLLLRLSSPPPFFFSCVLFLCTSISLCGASPHTTPTNSPSPLIVQLFSLFCHLFQPLWLAHCLSCSIVRDSACLIYKRCSVSHSIPRFKNCLFFGCCFLQEFSLFCECAWMAHCFTSYIV